MLGTGKELIFGASAHTDALAHSCASLPDLMRLSTPKNAKNPPKISVGRAAHTAMRPPHISRVICTSIVH
jgi:hypothetical protein